MNSAGPLQRQVGGPALTARLKVAPSREPECSEAKDCSFKTAAERPLWGKAALLNRAATSLNPRTSAHLEVVSRPLIRPLYAMANLRRRVLLFWASTENELAAQKPLHLRGLSRGIH